MVWSDFNENQGHTSATYNQSCFLGLMHLNLLKCWWVLHMLQVYFENHPFSLQNKLQTNPLLFSIPHSFKILIILKRAWVIQTKTNNEPKMLRLGLLSASNKMGLNNKINSRSYFNVIKQVHFCLKIFMTWQYPILYYPSQSSSHFEYFIMICSMNFNMIYISFERYIHIILFYDQIEI